MAAKCDLVLCTESTPRAQAQGEQALAIQTVMEEMNLTFPQ